MKRIMLILCICLMLSGCQEKARKVPEEAYTVTMSLWEPGTEKELSAGVQQVIDDYQQLHPDVQVKIQVYPVEEYNESLRELYSMDALPEIISNHAYDLKLLAQKGILLDISKELSQESSYEKQTAWKDVFDKQFCGLANSLYEDGCYNIPFFNNETAVFYNREVYQKLGLQVPKTWNELISNFEIIQKNGKTAIGIMEEKEDMKLWLDWEIGNEIGLETMLANPDINLNGDDRITEYEISCAIQSGAINYETDFYIHEWYEEYAARLEKLFQYSTIYKGVGESAVKASFLDGDFVHLNTGSWDAVSILGDERFGVFRFPTSASCSAVQSMAVTTSAEKAPKQKETVIDFLQFFTSREEYQKFTDITLQLPVIKGVTMSPQMRCFENDGMSSKTALSYVGYDCVEARLRGKQLKFEQNYFREIEERAQKKALDNLTKYYQENAEDYLEAKFVRKGDPKNE